MATPPIPLGISNGLSLGFCNGFGFDLYLVWINFELES